MTAIVLELPEDEAGRAFPDGINMHVETVPRRGDTVLVSAEDDHRLGQTRYVVAEVRHDVRAVVSTSRAYVGVVVVRLAAPGNT